MGNNVKVKFIAVDLLPSDAPCAVIGEPDDLTYMVSRAVSPDEIARGLTNLYQQLSKRTSWRVDETA